MNKLKVVNLGAAALCVSLLAGCLGTNFDGDYAINKEKTLNSPAIKEAEEMSPMMAGMQKMLIGTMLNAVPKMKINDGVVKIGTNTCEINSSDELMCGEDEPSGTISKTEGGVVVVMQGNDGRVDLHYDLLAKQ